MKKLRKLLVIGVMVLSVVAMSGVVVAPASASASTGDLIKMAGNSSVYYLGSNGKRYVFPNSTTYFSWYPDFSGVVTIPASELQSYPLGGNVTMRAGTKMVKITTDPSVYAVEPNGALRKIQSEAQAAALYGTNWNKRVVDVPDAFFVNYTVGAVLANGATPAGSLVKNASAANVYYYDGTNYRLISNEAAMTANRFQMANVLTASSTVAAGGTSVTNAEFVNVAQNGGTGPVVTGSGLMVSLSSSTSAASTLIYGQANANLATFNFTAANDGPVTVKTLKVKRTGVSSDALLTAAYLYEGSNRLTDNATVSANYITFNNAAGLFTVAAGATKSITVKSNISSTTTDGANVAVAINAASDVTSTGASVTGSFPLTGNTMSVSSATLSTFAFNAATTPAATDVDAGQTDFTLWKNVTSIGNRDIRLESIRFRQIGSVTYSDLQNLSFYVDGVKKGSTQQLGTDGYVTFDFSSSPVNLISGSRTLELRGDVIGGSSKTYSFSVQQATDLVAADSQYNAYVTATNVPATTGTQTVLAGTLSVTKLSTSPSGNITKDASNATLAKYEFKAYGESMKVEYLKVTVDSSRNANGKLRNGALYANGVQIGSTADLNEKNSASVSTTYSLGSSLIVTPGSPVTVEIRADIYDNDGTNDVTANDTFVPEILVYTNGAQRQSSLGYVNVPSAAVTGNTLTVKTGSISLSKENTYGNQNVVIPNTNYKLGSFVLTGNSIEDTSVNSFQVDFTAGDAFLVSKLNDVYLKYGSKTSTIKSTVNASGNTWSVSENLVKNANMTIEVWGNISTFTVADNNDTMISSLLVSGTTVGSSQTVTTNSGAVLAGQTVTAKTGSITSSLDATAPVSAVVVGGASQDLAAYRFTTTNDNYNLTEVVVTVADAAAASNISSLSLKDGVTVIATVPVSGTTATFSGLSIPVAANAYKVLTVSGALGTVGFGAGNTGADLTTTLASFKANNSQGTETSEPAANKAGKAIYVYKAIPTISIQTLPSTLLSAGTLTVAKFSITGSTNTVAWKKLSINVAKSANPTIAALAGANGSGSVTLYDETNTAVPGTIAFAGLVGGAANAEVVFTATNEQQISGSKTYTLKATIGGAPVAGDSISTAINHGVVAYAASNDYTTVSGTAASFVWSDMAGDQSTPTHDEAATSNDWNNDWLIKNIPTDSQTLTK